MLGIQEFATEATEPIPPGTHQVRMEFAYDGGGLAKGGDVTLYYDGDRCRHRPRRGDSGDDLLRRRDHRRRLRVRHGGQPPTTRPHTSRFTGRIHWVQIDLGDDDHDHFIDPDERLRIAMARQ